MEYKSPWTAALASLSKLTDKALAVCRHESHVINQIAQLPTRTALADVILLDSSNIIKRLMLLGVGISNRSKIKAENINLFDEILSIENELTKSRLFGKFAISAISMTVQTPDININDIKEDFYTNPFSEKKVALFLNNEEKNFCQLHLNEFRYGDSDILNIDLEYLEHLSAVQYKCYPYETQESFDRLFKTFVIFHEMAHASNMQKLEDYKDDEPKRKQRSEIQSDVCSILKTIDYHNLSHEQAIEACNSVLSFRINHYDFLKLIDNDAFEVYHENYMSIAKLGVLIRDKEYFTRLRNLDNDEIQALAKIISQDDKDNDHYTLLKNFIGEDRSGEMFSKKLYSLLKNEKFNRLIKLNIKQANESEIGQFEPTDTHKVIDIIARNSTDNIRAQSFIAVKCISFMNRRDPFYAINKIVSHVEDRKARLITEFEKLVEQANKEKVEIRALYTQKDFDNVKKKIKFKKNH